MQESIRSTLWVFRLVRFTLDFFLFFFWRKPFPVSGQCFTYSDLTPNVWPVITHKFSCTRCVTLKIRNFGKLVPPVELFLPDVFKTQNRAFSSSHQARTLGQWVSSGTRPNVQRIETQIGFYYPRKFARARVYVCVCLCVCLRACNACVLSWIALHGSACILSISVDANWVFIVTYIVNH